MTELSFAKSFLSTLSARSTKLPPDHAADPKTFEPKGPYTLPRMPQSMKKRQTLAPGQERSVKVRLRSLRNPPLDMICSEQSMSTSIHDLKRTLAEQAAIPADKIRLLYRKKPCADAKTLKDLLAEGEVEVEFSVMVMGGGGSSTPGGGAVEEPVATEEAAEGPAAALGASGEALLETEEFWEDLKGFLMQRLKDQKMSEQLSGGWRRAWMERGQGQ